MISNELKDLEAECREMLLYPDIGPRRKQILMSCLVALGKMQHEEHDLNSLDQIEKLKGKVFWNQISTTVAIAILALTQILSMLSGSSNTTQPLSQPTEHVQKPRLIWWQPSQNSKE